ncbi:MAG: endonuclease/exonuclease/phosphatase family protein [Clostridia bacterium]|nr:endonuclease/exonuclease/phosphatase family protein [Clostridia bacterium]
MKLMTFNTQHCLNYMTRNIDFDVMVAAIRQCGADVVGLNEMRGAGPHPEFAPQVEILAEKSGLTQYFFAPALHMRAGTYGNGLLSRVPVESAEIVMIPDPDPRKYNGYYETRCLLKATLAGGITVLVTHFGLNPDEQENAVQTIVQHLADEKCILMGDFNVLPDDPVLNPIRARMKDAAEAICGDKNTFPSDAPDRKIDYIFVSPDVEVLCAEVPPIVASDHRPHTAEVEI